MSIKSADNLLSQIVRKRDKVCKRCGNPERDNMFSKLDCAHFISKALSINTRYNENNVAILCRSCHSHLHEKSLEHHRFFIKLLGQEVVDDLWALAFKPSVIYKSWYGGREHMKELRERLKEI